jgi:hypothetical protein
MQKQDLVINEDPRPNQVRWKVGNRTLDEVVATIMDLPKDRMATTSMIHSWRKVWRTKNPTRSKGKGEISLSQTTSDLKAGEAVGAFRRGMIGSSEVWRIVPDVLGLNNRPAAVAATAKPVSPETTPADA